MLVLPASENQEAGSPISPSLFTQDLSIKTRREEIKSKTWNVIELTQAVIRLWTAKTPRCRLPFMASRIPCTKTAKMGNETRQRVIVVRHHELAIYFALSVSSGCWQWRPVTAFTGVTRKGVHCDPCWPLTIKSGWRVDHYQVWILRLRVMVTENFRRCCLQTTFLLGHHEFHHDSLGRGRKEKSLRNVYSHLRDVFMGF